MDNDRRVTAPGLTSAGIQERVQKALSIFGLVELSLKNDAPTVE
jgi:hypothetical protein